MKEKREILGLGLDAQDGHKRVTLGKNFRLYGGSQSTHALLQEKSIKINEQLKSRHKTLDDVGKEELCDIAYKVGLKPLEVNGTEEASVFTATQ
ncbi:MAG: hypothetical protein JW844_02495 [Candidatus Omnitrophica bacterium]|nr:hypothetical protein [Candidatus Omnitrophota bacterium]